MADTKITALTAITTVDPAVDVLPIVDVSDTTMAASGTTKKITSNQILGAGGTATLASATITGDLTVDTNTLKVDSANNRVGIGTASPANQLSVRNEVASGIAVIDVRGGSAGAGAVQISGNATTLGTTSFDLIQNSSGAFVNQRDANPLSMFVNGSERYAISSSGVATWSNVGGVAGTAMTLNSTGLGVGKAPLARLDVASARAASVIGGIVGTTGTGAVNDECQFLIKNVNTASGQNNGAGIGGLLEASASNKSSLLFYVDNGTAVTNVGRFDSNGNLGIGVTPSAWGGAWKVIEFNNGHSFGSAGSQSAITQNAYNNGTNWIYKTSALASLYQANSGVHYWYTAPSGTAGNAITFTQAMTLDASGNLLVTKTSYGLSVGFAAASTGAIDSVMASAVSAQSTLNVYSTGAGAYRFYVGMNGTINATNTTISAISDARLKENVQDIDVGLGAILALKPRKFDWKAGKGKDIKGDRGFIAQEFEQVFPQLVDEWKDEAPEGEAPYKSVRQDLIPVLVKAIQELTARVQTLETR